MTPGIVRALAEAERLSSDDFAKLQRNNDPILADAKLGNPISHSQLIDLSKLLKKHASELPTTPQPRSNDASDVVITRPSTANDSDNVPTPFPTTLAILLHSTTIYTPLALPKPSPTPQYIALMSRLRAEEEARTYERMLHPPPTRETFTQRFPRAPMDFSIGSSAPMDTDEDLSYEEVHRQIILIINILISIVCVAVFIWVAARHWSVGKRLGLSLAGSLGIAVAEVAVYAGYVRKVKEAKRTEKKKPEIKQIVKSWVLDKGEEKEGAVVGGKDKDVDSIRFRKGKHR